MQAMNHTDDTNLNAQETGLTEGALWATEALLSETRSPAACAVIEDGAQLYATAHTTYHFVKRPHFDHYREAETKYVSGFVRAAYYIYGVIQNKHIPMLEAT